MTGVGDRLYVVFTNVYEQRDVDTIFLSLETAQAVFPGEWTEYHPNRWSRDNKDRLEDEYAEIVRYEISG